MQAPARAATTAAALPSAGAGAEEDAELAAFQAEITAIDPDALQGAGETAAAAASTPPPDEQRFTDDDGTVRPAANASQAKLITSF